MQAYENGKHAYHATMPTDALKTFRDVMMEAKEYGFDTLKKNQQQLGHTGRTLLQQRGFKSVASPPSQPPV